MAYNYLKKLQTWVSPDLWSHLELAGEIIEVTCNHLDENGKALVANALKQKLFQSGLTMEDVKSLIPFFEQGGSRLDKISVSNSSEFIGRIKIIEPEALEDTWLLETVVRGKKSSVYWTPAFRKKSLPIKDALPDKWSAFIHI